MVCIAPSFSPSLRPRQTRHSCPSAPLVSRRAPRSPGQGNRRWTGCCCYDDVRPCGRSASGTAHVGLSSPSVAGVSAAVTVEAAPLCSAWLYSPSAASVQLKQYYIRKLVSGARRQNMLYKRQYIDLCQKDISFLRALRKHIHHI